MTISFDTLRDKWMADPEFRKAYDAISPEMEIAFAVAEARHLAKLTQAQLAERIGTSQAMIARWEKGAVMPSTKSLKRLAEATGTRLKVELVSS
jgi:ribosome-binding protein aMBF1 (putative translation factor)